MDIRAVEDPETDAFVAAVKAYIPASGMTAAQVRFERECLSHVRACRFYGATFYLASEDGEVRTMHIARPSTAKKKNAWGRYVSAYFTYTHPASRRRGYASASARILQDRWCAAGYDRLKTTTDNYAGFCYHHSLGHQMWGVNRAGDLVVDTPLNPLAEFPEGIPIECRPYAWNIGGPLTTDDLQRILTTGIFCADEAEVSRKLGAAGA